MAKETGGHYLRLENYFNICDFIMGICYRESSYELFTNYEAEVAAHQGISGLRQDVNKMFATLRRENSNLSCKSGTSNLEHTAATSSSTIDTEIIRHDILYKHPVITSQSSWPPHSFRRRLSSSNSTSSSGSDTPSSSSSLTSSGSSTNSVSSSRSDTPMPSRYSSFTSVTSSGSGVNSSESNVISSSTFSRSSFDSVVSSTDKKFPKLKKSRQATKKREKEPESKFNLRKLDWTSWKLAYSPEKPDDTRKWLKMYRMNGYRRKTLFPRSLNLKVYEVSVQTHPRGKLHVMYARITASDLNDSQWCLFPGSRRRHYIHCRQIKRVLRQGCRVFVRKADIKKRQMKQVDNLNKYSYAWTRSISGTRTPERTVVKDDKILSGMDYS